MLRSLRRGVDTDAWTWLSDLCGQQLFYPPDVAGWDDERWLDTCTWRGRWLAAAQALRERQLDPDSVTGDPTERAAVAVDRALEFWGRPSISRTTRAALERFAERSRTGAGKGWKQEVYPVLRQNALRMMIATSPDLQSC
jgi:hypothetical protein